MQYNLTKMVQFFVDNPSQNFGFVISVAMDDPSLSHKNNGTDTVYQGYCFAGAVPFVDSLKAYKPKLDIVFNEISEPIPFITHSKAVPDIKIIQQKQSLIMFVPGKGSFHYEIFDVSGKTCMVKGLALKGQNTTISLTKTAIIVMRIVDNHLIFNKKIVFVK